MKYLHRGVWFALLTILWGAPGVCAADRLVVVHVPNADPLEMEAANDLGDKLRLLYPDAVVQVGPEKVAGARQTFVLGNPDRHPKLRAPSDLKWPSLTQQGFTFLAWPGDPTMLVVGGNRPLTTWWGVHELTHRLGFRHYPHGDERPSVVPTLPMAIEPRVSEPRIADRGWRTWGTSPLGAQTWSVAEYATIFRQLSKMRFNRVVFQVEPWHPFVKFEYSGIKSATGVLWRGERFLTEGDLVGKKALPRGQRWLSNSEFGETEDYDQMLQRGDRYLRQIHAAAQKYGLAMTVQLGDEVGREFAPCFLQASPVERTQVVRARSSEGIADLVNVVSQAYQRQYDFLDDPMRFRQVAVHGLGGTSGFLPQTYHAMFTTACNAAGDVADQKGMQAVMDLHLPYEAELATCDVARALWDGHAADLKTVFVEHWVTLTGKPAAAERLWLAEEKLIRAEQLLVENDPDFAAIDPQMFTRHARNEPAPAWWKEVTEAYDSYLTESYRVHGAAEGRIKDLVYYRAKRGEFAFEYMNAIAALREAAIQKAGGDTEASAESMEKALESLYNAINHVSDSARGSSDRALVAVLNAYAFQPLQAAIDGADGSP